MDKITKLILEGDYLNGFEMNFKGKEYKDDILIFEGEFFHLKKNGRGREFNEKDGNLLFEGEYINDKKIRGKLFINNKLEFEGEYLFDKKWNGKGYDDNGNLKYELINGNGKVIEYDNYGFKIFEGEYLNGKRNGKGKEYEEGELIFEGEYIEGKKNYNYIL